MRHAGKFLTAGLLALWLSVPASAQNPYFMGQGAAPVFQVNPLLGQAANQALVNQAVLNQAVTQQAVAARAGGFGNVGGGIPGLPNYLGAASITSTPATTPLPSGTTWGGNGSNGGFNNAYNNPYNSPYYIQPPIGAYLNGIANVTMSYGQYMQDYQKSRIMQEDIVRSKIQSRRALIEEWRWEQSLIPKAEDIRRAELERDLARATKQAPIGEILSGKSLNVLLTQLKQLQANQKRGPVIPTSEDTLAQLNVSVAHGRNVGAIRSGKVSWPIALREDLFTKFRDKIDQALMDAVDQAKKFGKVDKALLNDLDRAQRGMDEILDRVNTDITLAQYMQAKRTLESVAEGVRALQEPDVGNNFNRRYEVRGKSIADVVDYMNNEGLIFLSAMPGNEGAYRTMYAWLLSYYEAMNQYASR